MTSASRRLLAPPMYLLQKQPLPIITNVKYCSCIIINILHYQIIRAEYSLRESVSAQGREGRGFDSDPGRKKKGYILSRDSEVTLSHWSRSIELVIMPLIDL
jgi:hypothetical protein